MKKGKAVKIAALVLGIIAAAAGGVYAQQQVITEQAVVDAALKNNPGLIAAEKMARSYESKSHKQFFLENPMVGVEFMGVPGTGVEFGSAMEKNLVISQKIPFPLKYIWKIGGAAAESDIYRYMYEMKKLETIAAARIAYYELHKTMKFIDITGSAAGLLKQLSSIAFVKYNQGMVPQQDVVKMDLEKDMLENELLVLNRQKEIDLQKIRRIAGDDSFMTATAYALGEISVPELKKGFDEIKEAALTGSPSVKASAASKGVAENMRNMALADYIPDLNVAYRKNVSPGSNQYSIMLEAEVPLWFLNNQQADIGEKWEMAASKENELKEERNRIVALAKEHYEVIKSDSISMALFKNSLIPRAEAALKSAMTSYQSKKIEFMALLDSERMLLDLKKEYYMIMTEYLMHFRMLEELIGSVDAGAESGTGEIRRSGSEGGDPGSK